MQWFPTCSRDRPKGLQDNSEGSWDDYLDRRRPWKLKSRFSLRRYENHWSKGQLVHKVHSFWLVQAKMLHFFSHKYWCLDGSGFWIFWEYGCPVIYCIAFSSITFDKIKLYKRFIMFYVIYSYILVRFLWFSTICLFSVLKKQGESPSILPAG